MNTSQTEVESKIIEVSHIDLKDTIIELWWEKVSEWEYEAVWMENFNWAKIRVRKEWEKTVTEHKESMWNNKSIKQCIETWYSPDDFENQIKVFELLWLKQTNRSVKNRISYILHLPGIREKVKIEFDKYSDLDGQEIPEFFEIEATTEEAVLKTAKILWFKQTDLKNWYAWELSEYYKQK